MSATIRPVTMIRPAAGWFDLDLPGVWHNRELLWQLILRELRLRCKQAALGVAWAILQPALTVTNAAISVCRRVSQDAPIKKTPAP
jgi:lipopolysaccharide transport system permease protein